MIFDREYPKLPPLRNDQLR